MLLRKIDQWVKQSISAANIKLEERRSGAERRQCTDRRSETRFGGEPDRRQGGERRRYPLEQKLIH